MRKRSNKKTDHKKGLDPTIVVALIGLAGTVIAALLASPLLDRLLPGVPAQTVTPIPVLKSPTGIQLSRTAMPVETSFATTLTQTSQVTTPTQVSNTATGPHAASQPIRLNQTVTGTLYGAEAGIWLFSEGPAAVTIILDVGPFGDALIILRDPAGVDRAYVDQQTRPGVTQLVNFFIPTEEEYTIWVRNTANEQVDYTLTVQDARTPPPP